MIGVSYMKITIPGSAVSSLYSNPGKNTNALFNNDVIGSKKKRANGLSKSNDSDKDTGSVSAKSSSSKTTGDSSYDSAIKNIDNNIQQLNAKIKEIRTSDMDEKTKQAEIQMINQQIQSLQQQKQQIQLQAQREQMQKQTEEQEEKEKEKQEEELKNPNNIDNNQNDIIVSDSLTSLLQADSSKKISQDLKSTEASMKVTESYVEDMRNDSISGLGIYHDTSNYDNQLSKLNSGIANLEGQSNDEIGKSLDSIEIANDKAQVEAAEDRDSDKDNDKIDDKDEQSDENNDDKNSLYKEAEIVGEKVDKYA